MLTRRLALLMLPLVAAAASCNSNPTGANQTAVFSAQLLAASETPAITNTESNGAGTVTLTMTYSTDSAGTVTTATADFQVTVTGFAIGSALTMAHVHQGAANTTGAIVVNTTLAIGDVALTNGGGTFSETNIKVPNDIAQQWLSSPTNFYFDVHTILNPNGAIRGQLSRQN